MALAKAKDFVSSAPVVVFSKTNCAHCEWVKVLLRQLGVGFKVIELDLESDGSDIQSALAEWTAQRKLPIVFIGGNHIGGCERTKTFFTRMLHALEDASIVKIGEHLHVIEKLKLSLPPAVDTVQLRSQLPTDRSHSVPFAPVIDSEDQEVSDDDDDRNHKHRKREAQANTFDNDVQEPSMRQINRKRNRPLEGRKMYHDSDNNSNIERDVSSSFEKRRPIFTPATGRPPVGKGRGRGRGRSIVSWSQQDSRFNPIDTLDFASQMVSQGLPTHPGLFVGTGIPNAATTQNASWGTYGFVPGMSNRILDPLQPLGLQGTLQSTIAPLFNMGMPRQRCRDFDEQGFCLRGDMCPMEHGVNRIVVEDVQSLSQFNLPVSDPNSNALGLQSGSGSLPSIRPSPGLFTGSKFVPAKDGKPVLSADALKLSGVSSASVVVEADVYDPDQPLWNNKCSETSGTGLMLPLLNNDEPLWNLDSSQQSLVSSNGFQSEQASRPFRENIGAQNTNSSVWGRIRQNSRSEMGIKTNNNSASTSHLSDEMKEDNEKSTVKTSSIPEKQITAEMSQKAIVRQPLPRLYADSSRHNGRMSQKASRTLYVHGIPEKSNTKDALFSHFQKFGEVVDIYIPLNSEKAFVQFSKRVEAEAALEAPDAVMGNRFIKLWWANRDRIHDAGKSSHHSKLPLSSSMGVSGFSSYLSGTDKEKGNLKSTVPTGSKTPSELLVTVPGPKGLSANAPKIASPMPKKLDGLELLKEELRKKQEILAQKRDEFRRQLDKFEKQSISVKRGELVSEQAAKKLKVDMGNEAAKSQTPIAPLTTAGTVEEVEKKRKSEEVLVSRTSIVNSTILQNCNVEQTSHPPMPKSDMCRPDNQSTSFRILPPLPADLADVVILQDHFSSFGDLASIVLEEHGERSENEGMKTPENFCAHITFTSCDSAQRAYVGGQCWQGQSLHFMWLSESDKSNRVCDSQETLGPPGSSNADIQDGLVTSVMSSTEGTSDGVICKVTVVEVESNKGVEAYIVITVICSTQQHPVLIPIDCLVRSISL
ncbi:zinc finger CCCH domain-containing protein [Musa troglodytarum]|uniref:Zinc finger CCCH domain-containing protein n=1 Tax=Musa troglodytarum TaxID=320322 RepID=A0A9E7FEY2_9LILI|nr:zinc finger CCCH domain-containing protein [Musa troglodytarum]URD94209.1 zinc finger CCCH domain-containing protein [Musa troglodytarum]